MCEQKQDIRDSENIKQLAKSEGCLHTEHIRYEEEGPKKFKHEMELQIMDALTAPEWDKDKQKKGYTHFVEN